MLVCLHRSRLKIRKTEREKKKRTSSGVTHRHMHFLESRNTFMLFMDKDKTGNKINHIYKVTLNKICTFDKIAMNLYTKSTSEGRDDAAEKINLSRSDSSMNLGKYDRVNLSYETN